MVDTSGGANETVRRVVAIDFQFVNHGHPLVDVLRMLLGSLSAAERRAHESALVEHYRAALCEQYALCRGGKGETDAVGGDTGGDGGVKTADITGETDDSGGTDSLPFSTADVHEHFKSAWNCAFFVHFASLDLYRPCR
jgi:hypothetical protein